MLREIQKKFFGKYFSPVGLFVYRKRTELNFYSIMLKNNLEKQQPTFILQGFVKHVVI